jgi:WD40 repeat protein
LIKDVKVPSWSADGKRLVTTCEDKFHYLYRAEDGTELKKFRMPHDHHSPAILAFSADGVTLASGNRDGTVSLFRVAQAE